MKQALTFEEFTRAQMDEESIKERGVAITEEEWTDFLEKEKDSIKEVKDTFVQFTLMHVEIGLQNARELAIALGLDPEKADKLLTAYTSNDIK